MTSAILPVSVLWFGKCQVVAAQPHYCLIPSFRIDPGGSFFEENSLFPSLKKLLSGLLISIRTNPNLTIFIAPAVYLFLAICNTALLAYRRRSSRILLFIIPALIQSITLAVVNTSSDFRYRFGCIF